LVQDGERDVADLLHREHSWLFETIRLQILKIFRFDHLAGAEHGHFTIFNRVFSYISLNLLLFIIEVLLGKKRFFSEFCMILIDFRLLVLDRNDLGL